MMTRQLASITLLTILSFNLFAQKVTGRQKELLLKAWKATLKCIKMKDTAGLRTVCFDTIGYTDIDGRGIDAYRYISLSVFIKQTFDSIVPHKGLQKAIYGNKPILEIVNGIYFKDGSEHSGYCVVFYQPKRRRKTNMYTLNVVAFTYIDFKLNWILRRQPLI